VTKSTVSRNMEERVVITHIAYHLVKIDQNNYY